jgi:peptidase M23-like protein
MRLTVSLAVLAVLHALAPPAGALTWRRPVAGPVARSFAYGPDPFRRGWHRGVDLAAAAGARIHAACAGTVVTARPAGVVGGVVTIRCGRWRVTHLPLASVAVHRGEAVAAGAPIGDLAAGSAHAGLHLGVRRASDRFGYVDPLRLLPAATHEVPPVALVRGRRADLGRAPASAPAARPAPAPASAPAARPAPAPAAAAPAPAAVVAPPPGTRENGAAARVRALAPWPAWAGLALLLAGAAGGGVRLGRRHVQAGAATAVREGVA